MNRIRLPLAARAGEMVNTILRTLERGNLVERFIGEYVDSRGRRGLLAFPERHRELVSTIRREALLAMVARVEAHLPSHLRPRAPRRGVGGKRRKKKHQARNRTGLQPAELDQAKEFFLTEFHASLSRALRWTPGDVSEFLRDLELLAPPEAPARPALRSEAHTERAAGAFVDRCALLLDPSMLEEARQAAARFLTELERITDRILDAVLRRRRR